MAILLHSISNQGLERPRLQLQAEEKEEEEEGRGVQWPAKDRRSRAGRRGPPAAAAAVVVDLM